jgi:hypothetical protein
MRVWKSATVAMMRAARGVVVYTEVLADRLDVPQNRA